MREIRVNVLLLLLYWFVVFCSREEPACALTIRDSTFKKTKVDLSGLTITDSLWPRSLIECARFCVSQELLCKGFSFVTTSSTCRMINSGNVNSFPPSTTTFFVRNEYILGTSTTASGSITTTSTSAPTATSTSAPTTAPATTSTSAPTTTSTSAPTTTTTAGSISVTCQVNNYVKPVPNSAVCYRVVTNSKPFDQAQTACQSDSDEGTTRLAEPRTSAESTALINYLKDNFSNIGDSLFLGFKNPNGNVVKFSSDNTALSYTPRWKSGQPSSQYEKCVMISNIHATPKWEDDWCTSGRKFVCEERP
ncbi:uncharacterized protein LOC141899182 [Tubulanus polymorphus]|uniref:uncharacterized protein LOC141899182 n=1 Tax=Tubulanus polymorphus TaxID=672921 RepID=UPI003DA6C545